MAKPALQCPACGSSERIYARIDARWDAKLGAFNFCPSVEAPLECTDCDYEWGWHDTDIEPLGSALSVR